METAEPDFAELLRLFNKHRVRYCIVGAFAVAAYARPRYTKDLDIFVWPQQGNGERICKALRDFGFGSLAIEPKDFVEKGRVIQLGYEPLRIDLVTSIDGVTFEQVWKRKKVKRYGMVKAYFIGLDDLIKNKRALGRKQDLVDMEILRDVKKRKK
jgi:hypothetical protein